MRARRVPVLVALGAAALAAAVAAAAGLIGSVAAKDASLAGGSAPGGVTVNGSPYRYVAISPRRSPRLTVVERIDLAGGRVGRWWYLRGGWAIPAGSYRAEGAGLSADEGTLVLAAIANGDYGRRPRTTRLAVLDTRVHLRHPTADGKPAPEHAVRRIALHGEYEVAAVSPDGSEAFLIGTRHPDRPGQPPAADLEVRALDLASGRLASRPILTRDGAPVQLGAAPIDRVASRDGRWSYGLYIDQANEVFVLGIDTVDGTVARVDLPRSRFGNRPFGSALRESGDGTALIVFRRDFSSRGHSPPLATVPLPLAGPTAAPEPASRERGPFGFLFTPVGAHNLVGREGVAGRSVDGREIAARQWGDPERPALVVFGCIHGDECAASGLRPSFARSGGCPDPAANIVAVPNLDPDGRAAGTRLNGDGVDLNRNFAASWRPIGRPGDLQYSGPRPFSEPESRLAARLVRAVEPRVTIWFHQHHGPRAFVRAWGQSAPAGRRFARRAGIPFHLMPWPDGTAPNWQNHRFPGTSSFVVELPRGPLGEGVARHLSEAIARTGHEVGEDGSVTRKG